MPEGIEKLCNEELGKVAGGSGFFWWYYTVRTNGSLYAPLLNDKSEVLDQVANGAKVVSSGLTRNGSDAYGNPCLLRFVQKVDGGVWGWMSSSDLSFDYASRD